jgi:hypothetical protein
MHREEAFSWMMQSMPFGALRDAAGFGKKKVSPDNHRAVVENLLTWNEEAVSQVDLSGRLPLAHALESGQPWAVVSLLIEAYPGALQVFDVVSGLYMFQLASVDKSTALDISYSMLRRLPGVLQVARKATDGGNVRN